MKGVVLFRRSKVESVVNVSGRTNTRQAARMVEVEVVQQTLEREQRREQSLRGPTRNSGRG